MKGGWVPVLLVVVACGQPPSDRVGDAVAEADRDLAIYCRGVGAPTVVIDAGLGEASGDWMEVAVALSESVRVCTFDRPGYGESESGPFPRTPDANAADLRAGLARAEIEAPFVLVGHSLGGLNAQAYWKLHPGDVLGLILLDPPPRGWLEQRRFPGLWDTAVLAGEELRAAAAAATAGSPNAARLAAMASEHNGMLEGGAAAAAIDSFGALPLLVLAAERPNPAFGDSAVAFQSYWIDESRTLASRSSRGQLYVLESTGHSMNREAPEAVTFLILEFLRGL